MNVKFLNPFVIAAREILSIEMHETVQRGELRLDGGVYMTDDVTVIISLVGAVEGTVFYSMSEKSATGMVSAMMGEKFYELDKLVQSGIAELCNVITGRASMGLAEAGFEANISAPALILGKGATISTLDNPRVVVPLALSIGSMTIHLALREGTSNLKTPQMPVPKAFEVPPR